MRLTVKAPFFPDEHAQVQVPTGASLRQLLADKHEHIMACQVNGQFCEEWRSYEPQQHDAVTLFVQPQEFISLTAILTAVITAVISTAISFALSAIIRALTPTPSRTEGKVEQVFGIAGLTNTTAQGTPKLLCYGRRRVYGHILTTRCTVIDSGRSMAFGVLYFMGEGPIHNINQVQINDIDAGQFNGVEVFGRLGGDDNAELVHPDFATLSQVWSDGRQLPVDTFVVYQTRSAKTEKATLILYTPYLQTDGGGSASHTISIDTSTVAAASYAPYGSGVSWSDTSLSPRFRAIEITFPGPNQWLIRLKLTATTNASSAGPTLFNVMEEQSGDATYPHSALLAITGVASSQIPSFDSLKGSAMIEGLLVAQPDTEDPADWDGETFVTGWTQERAWILRDILTNPRIGFGNRIPASMFDDRAALDVQAYWNGETTPGSGIPRNVCDILINDRRPGWDWIKLIAQEGRSILQPSQGKLKLIVDKADIPALTYSRPGNIVEGSESFQLGSGQGLLPNNILLQFMDQDNNYNPHILRYPPEGETLAGAEGEPDREAPAVTVYSITDWNHAFWAARYELLRQRLIQRHVQWSSPITAMVSEPFDHVAFASETPHYGYGFSGFLNEDSTTDRLVLDRPVLLQEEQAYTVMVRHQATNTVETRAVATAAGTWGAIEPEHPFDTAPVTGDLWVLGILETTLLHLVIDEVQQEETGYRLLASRYEPELYTYPDVPASPIPPPPTESSPPPEEGSGGSGDTSAPSAPWLWGSFGGSGTIHLEWNPVEPAEGDTISQYVLYFSLGDTEHFAWYATILGPFPATFWDQVVAELPVGYFAVQAQAESGGVSALSNFVFTDWA